MRATRQSTHPTTDCSHGGRGEGTGRDGAGRAWAFRDGSAPIVELQARLRVIEEHGRGSLVTSGIPRPRALQILDSVLRLPAMTDSGIESRNLRVDLHREDSGRWQHHYGLALAISMVSSLANTPVPSNVLLLGDIDLHGQVRDVPSATVDALNDAIDAFRVETPVTVVLARDSAVWVRSASTVRVYPCRTLADAIAATWHGKSL